MNKYVHIDRLKLTRFRNHLQTSLEIDRRHVVIFGENGAGKTNLLEAVSYLSPGRGMRRVSYDKIGMADRDGDWTVFVRLQGMNDEVAIGTGIQHNGAVLENQRRIHINGAQAKTSEALLEHSRILWLTPSMDGLFTGPASERRKFLDRMVLAVDPAHARRVSDFEKTMRARNRLLSEPAPDGQWLDANEVQLSELGVAVATARQEMISLLSRSIVANNDPDSPFPDALLSLSGTLEPLVADVSSLDLEREYRDRLRSARNMDARAGRTLEGPHRSDMVVTHRPKAMPAAQCSTGEQKALLIGLILAQAALVAEITGFPPILLLDEVAAHLDEGRRAALYQMLDDLECQAWMTGTDRNLFLALEGRANFVSVADGLVRTEEVT